MPAEKMQQLSVIPIAHFEYSKPRGRGPESDVSILREMVWILLFTVLGLAVLWVLSELIALPLPR